MIHSSSGGAVEKLQPTRPPRCSISLTLHARVLCRQSYRALLLVHELVIAYAPLHTLLEPLLCATASARVGGGHRYATVLVCRGTCFVSTFRKSVCAVSLLSHTSVHAASALRETRMHLHPSTYRHLRMQFTIGCMRTHASAHIHLDAYIWMRAYKHAFMNAIAVAIKRMQSHI